MFRFPAIRAGLLCLALIPAAHIASAQVKIAVVNVQKVLVDSDEIKKVQVSLDAKYKSRQDQITQLSKDLDNIQQQLASGKLNQQAIADYQAEGQRKQRDAQRISEDLQADIDRDRQDVLGKVTVKIQDIVKKYAEEKGFDFVVDVSQTVYFKPAYDITADVLAAYNKANPAK